MNYGYLWYVFWHRHSFGSALGHRPWTDGRDTPRAHCRFRHGEKEHSVGNCEKEKISGSDDENSTIKRRHTVNPVHPG